MKTDEELKKNFTFFLDEDGIVKIEWLIELEDRQENYRQAQLWAETANNFLNGNPDKKFNILIDLTPAGIGLMQPPPEPSREIYKKIMESPQWLKIAIIAHDPFLRVVAKFILYAAGRDETFRMFTTKEEAQEWLNK